MRAFILYGLIIEIILFVVILIGSFVTTSKTDLAGQGMESAYIVLYLLILVFLLLPATYVAFKGKHLWLAALLGLIPTICIINFLLPMIEALKNRFFN